MTLHDVITGQPAGAWHGALLAALAVAGYLLCVHAVRDHRALARLLWRADWAVASFQGSSPGRPYPEVPAHHHWFAGRPAAVRWGVSVAWGLAALACLVCLPRYPGAVTVAVTAADAVALAVLFRPRGTQGEVHVHEESDQDLA